MVYMIMNQESLYLKDIKQDYEWQVLVANREKVAKKYPKAMVIPATIDEIMLLYVKGEN